MPSQPILMPKLGLTMTEGTLVEWKVSAGDRVEVGEVIFVVETDKISNEIEAGDAGIVEALLVAENETVPVGTAVATLAVDGVEPSHSRNDREAKQNEGSRTESAHQSRPVPRASPEHTAVAVGHAGEELPRLRVTPLARRMAREAGLDLANVAGSGPRGRITADDVIAAGKSPAPEARSDGAPRTEDPASPSGVIPLNAFQKVTARRLTEAKRDIPHFYVFAEADVTELLALREQLNADPAFPRISVSHFILAALARALVARPALNRVWSDAGLVPLAQSDVGLAVEGPKGLVAPVVRNIGRSTVDEVATAANHLVDQVRSGRVSGTDLQGGATALSNVGMFGATALVPIINPGHSSILGVGRSQAVFRPDRHGRPELRQVLSLALSCDHRVVHGAEAARFLQTIQNGLEAPAALLRRAPEDRSQ